MGGANIIGVSFGYHDAACCLLQDGELVAAVQEERFSRVKNDPSLPTSAFRYCLQEGGITIADVDTIAYYEDPQHKLGRQVWMAFVPDLSAARRKSIRERLAAPHPVALIRERWGFDGSVEIVDHHLSHAASSYYFSGFDEAAILTVDGVGEWATTTYGAGRGATIERLEQVDFPDSLGFFYSAITAYLGFEVNEGEYKVMGLAPYGEPTYADRIRQLIAEGPRGQFQLDMRFFGFLEEDGMFSQALVDLLGHLPRERDSDLTRFHMDVARSTQHVLEEVLLAKTRYLHSQVPVDSLCMAGGVALNVVANGRCLREGPFRRLFVQPAAGDAGGAIGAAAVGYVRRAGKQPPVRPLAHVYLGPANRPADVNAFLRASGATYQDYHGDEAGLIKHTVDQLVAGKVVGWSQGRMEFGPRALGARSILADPRLPGMRDRINALVKMREAFRPFAPAVLASEAPDHFALDHASPFMLETCQVVSTIPLPAITHVDGSARIQTVSDATNPRFAALLRAFQDRTGCPIILNTSFNLRGEPIVCSIADAIRCFLRSQIDCLVIEDFALGRADIPQSWEELDHFADVPDPTASKRTVGHTVYTML